MSNYYNEQILKEKYFPAILSALKGLDCMFGNIERGFTEQIRLEYAGPESAPMVKIITEYMYVVVPAEYIIKYYGKFLEDLTEKAENRIFQILKNIARYKKIYEDKISAIHRNYTELKSPDGRTARLSNMSEGYLLPHLSLSDEIKEMENDTPTCRWVEDIVISCQNGNEEKDDIHPFNGWDNMTSMGADITDCYVIKPGGYLRVRDEVEVFFYCGKNKVYKKIYDDELVITLHKEAMDKPSILRIVYLPEEITDEQRNFVKHLKTKIKERFPNDDIEWEGDSIYT